MKTFKIGMRIKIIGPYSVKGREGVITDRTGGRASAVIIRMDAPLPHELRRDQEEPFWIIMDAKDIEEVKP